MKIGQKVRVVGLPDDKYNPKDLDGMIVSLDGDMNPILVLWSNGIRNSYVEKNLRIIYD
jgi:hypothetical protein